jgi:hypothetical protein
VRRIVRVRAPHGVTPELVVTLHPNGRLTLRELRRRKQYALEIGALYVGAVIQEVQASTFADARRRPTIWS